MLLLIVQRIRKLDATTKMITTMKTAAPAAYNAATLCVVSLVSEVSLNHYIKLLLAS